MFQASGEGHQLAAGMSSEHLAWLSNSLPSLTHCVTLGRSLSLCDPWFHHLQNEKTAKPLPPKVAGR